MNSPVFISGYAGHLIRSPARLSIIGFGLLIIAGALLLMLPVASTGHPVPMLDALFMSTSAVCVTGLAVIDVGQQLTLFGQIVLIGLVQAGGLGILTISTLLLLILTGRPTLTGQALIKDTYSHGEDRQSVGAILKSIFITALVIESIGAMVLYLATGNQVGWGAAAYPAVFHAVSAFCNAGFSLYPDSFVGFRENWAVNGALAVLIVMGGIGFVVIADVGNRFFSSKTAIRHLNLHSRLALATTAALILFGTIAILHMEWNNTLAPLSVPGRILAALFQSVSARTAGFNTLDIGVMANETLFLLCILMFIGACPGSCGGGIKTTTFAGLVIQGVSRLRGLIRPQVFNRTLTETSISNATSLVLISAILIATAVMGLMMSELSGLSHAQTRGRFLELFFEAVSAFGTVGLSAGVTTKLTAIGRIIIILLMFIGRLGPLVIGLALSREKISRFHYAEENVMIG